MKLRSIQVLRGIAASAVVVWHATSTGPLGAAGVDLFFVISGFIIGKVMVGRTAGTFLADRFWRIFPPYWIAALPWFLFAAYGGLLTLPRSLASLTLWPYYGVIAEPYLRPAWSLLFEVLFYSAAALSIRTRAPRLISAVALCLMAFNLARPGPLVGFLGFPLIAEFLFGLLIGRLPLDRRAAAGLLPLALIILCQAPSADFAAAPQLAGMPSRVFWWGVPAAVFVYSALSFEGLFRWRPAEFIGDASYSLYLTHLTVLMFVHGWLAVPACFAVGIAFHLWIERPLLRLRPNLNLRQHVHADGRVSGQAADRLAVIATRISR